MTSDWWEAATYGAIMAILLVCAAYIRANWV